MMLNVVFYNSEAVIRVAEKAMKYFAGHVGLRTTVDTIWFNGLYLKFYPRMVTVNTYGSLFYPGDSRLSAVHFKR